MARKVWWGIVSGHGVFLSVNVESFEEKVLKAPSWVSESARAASADWAASTRAGHLLVVLEAGRLRSSCLERGFW